MDQLVAQFYNKNEEFVMESYDVQFAGEDAVGFQGDYYKIVIVFVKAGGDRRTVNYFMKSLPSDEEKANKLKKAGYFNRELNVYTKIFKEFDRVQKATEYHARCTLTTECDIILEDLHTKGYRITKSRETFDQNHCLAALSSLAKFHAASIILEESKLQETGQEYRIEKEFAEFLNECGYKYTSGWYIAGMEAALAAAGESEKYGKNTQHFDKIKSSWKQLFEQALELCGPSKKIRNVMSHRDLWANNLMFNYNGNGDPENCILVDYQACRCMPPMGDVVSLLYLNTTSKEIQIYYKDFLKHYYEELNKELGLHGINVENILTWEDFMRDCEVYKVWALVQCLILYQLSLLTPEDTASVLNDDNYDRLLNVSREEFVVNVMRKDPVYKGRILDSINEFINLFIIKS